MITKIEVKELYRAFNHPITLKEENITMILGENGLGKTVIFKMIKRNKHSYIHLNLGRFAKVCFAYKQVTSNLKTHV